MLNFYFTPVERWLMRVSVTFFRNNWMNIVIKETHLTALRISLPVLFIASLVVAIRFDVGRLVFLLWSFSICAAGIVGSVVRIIFPRYPGWRHRTRLLSIASFWLVLAAYCALALRSDSDRELFPLFGIASVICALPSMILDRNDGV